MKNSNPLNLKKRKILITGGLGILGTSITNELIKNNAKILIIDKEHISIKKKQKLLNKNINYFKADLRNTEELKILSQKSIFKNLYGIINNAAIDTPPNKNKIFKNLFDQETNTVNEEIYNNIKIYLNTSRIFGKILYKNKIGNIINISSIYGMLSPDQNIYKKAKLNFEKPISYTIAKSSIYGFNKYLCQYFKYKNVRVNTVTLSGIYNSQNKNFVKLLSDKIPLNRMMRSKEAAQVICFMISDYSSYINGENIIVDGGYSTI